MLPYFHANGQLQYAKFAHLYLLDMRSLPNTHPQNFEDFKKYFAVSRSVSPASGNWSDVTIESTVMRNMKAHGGLTSGRGITESVLGKWFGGAAISTPICSALEDFVGLHFSTDNDKKKILTFFSATSFSGTLALVSLTTGVVANRDVNCHKILQEGKVTMSKMVGQMFGEINRLEKT